MTKAKTWLIVDTETTINDHVADFGAILVNRKGEILKDCAILLAEFRNEELFHDKNANDIWGYEGLRKRKESYAAMLDQGTRQIASVAAVNRWFEKIAAAYNPTLTAYNLAFDLDKMQKSGIDCSMFNDRFCLWHSAASIHGNTKAYRRFILDNHYFNSPTAKGNMSYKTNAEVMARYVTGEMLPDEPHTAYEDCKFYELPILLDIIKKKGFRERIKPYSWNAFQVKDNFSV